MFATMYGCLFALWVKKAKHRITECVYFFLEDYELCNDGSRLLPCLCAGNGAGQGKRDNRQMDVCGKKPGGRCV